MHRELGPALAHRAQRVDVAEHVGQRHHGVDHPGVAPLSMPVMLPRRAVQVADDVAHVLLGRHHLDPHDRLEQQRRRLRACLRGRPPAAAISNAMHAGVDVVVGAVEQRRLEVDHREAGENAGLMRRVQALLDARNEFSRHRAADDRVLEDEARARLARLEQHLDARELAGAAGLLLVGVVDLGRRVMVSR